MQQGDSYSIYPSSSSDESDVDERGSEIIVALRKEKAELQAKLRQATSEASKNEKEPEDNIQYNTKLKQMHESNNWLLVLIIRLVIVVVVGYLLKKAYRAYILRRNKIRRGSQKAVADEK